MRTVTNTATPIVIWIPAISDAMSYELISSLATQILEDNLPPKSGAISIRTCWLHIGHPWQYLIRPNVGTVNLAVGKWRGGERAPRSIDWPSRGRFSRHPGTIHFRNASPGLLTLYPDYYTPAPALHPSFEHWSRYNCDYIAASPTAYCHHSIHQP